MANDPKDRQQQQSSEDSTDLDREPRVSGPRFDDGESLGSDVEADDRTPSEQRAENPRPSRDE